MSTTPVTTHDLRLLEQRLAGSNEQHVRELNWRIGQLQREVAALKFNDDQRRWEESGRASPEFTGKLERSNMRWLAVAGASFIWIVFVVVDTWRSAG
jgi:hypothetical protein